MLTIEQQQYGSHDSSHNSFRTISWEHGRMSNSCRRLNESGRGGFCMPARSPSATREAAWGKMWRIGKLYVKEQLQLRSLQQRLAEEAPPQLLVVRFVNHQQKQGPLQGLEHEKPAAHGERIQLDHDYSSALQKKRRKCAEIKKQLEEKNTWFQSPYPAKLKVWRKTYNSAWESAEDYEDHSEGPAQSRVSPMMWKPCKKGLN